MSAGIRIRNSLNGLISDNHSSGNLRGLYFLSDVIAVPPQLVNGGNIVVNNIARYNTLGDIVIDPAVPAGSITFGKNNIGSPGKPPTTPGPVATASSTATVNRQSP